MIHVCFGINRVVSVSRPWPSSNTNDASLWSFRRLLL